MCNSEIKTLAPNHILKHHFEEMCNLLLTEKEKSARLKTTQEQLKEAIAIAPSKLVYPPNSVNPEQMPILTIDDDDSDDIVIIDPDQASRPRNNEGGTQIRELPRPNVSPASARSRLSRAIIEEESSRCMICCGCGHRGHQCNHGILEFCINCSRLSLDNSTTLIERIGDIQAQMRLDNQRYQEEAELVRSNGCESIRSMPRPHHGSNSKVPRPSPYRLEDRHRNRR